MFAKRVWVSKIVLQFIACMSFILTKCIIILAMCQTKLSLVNVIFSIHGDWWVYLEGQICLYSESDAKSFTQSIGSSNETIPFISFDKFIFFSFFFISWWEKNESLNFWNMKHFQRNLMPEGVFDVLKLLFVKLKKKEFIRL